MVHVSPKILVLSGSTRSGSYNSKLAALAVKKLAQFDAEPTRISLADHNLPIYDGDLEASGGVPRAAATLKQLLMAHHGVFIASPEYNAGVAPVLKNAIDWISRVRGGAEAPLAAFRGRVFAISSASPGAYGGMRGLIALRQVLELGLGATVLPEQVAVARAHDAFDPSGGLADERLASLFDALMTRLVAEAGRNAA